MPNKLCPKCNNAMVVAKYAYAIPGFVDPKLQLIPAAQGKIDSVTVLPVYPYQCQNKDCGYIELYGLSNSPQF